ncbi:MAG: hypothetical protein V7677_20265 [Motiliproteus sp.]
MSLNPFILSSKILIMAITLNACSLQKNYIQPHLEIDLIGQEIIEKQNVINNIELYIQSQKNRSHQSNGKQAMNINDRAVMKSQALMNIENSKKSLKIFKIQIDQLKLKQKILKQPFRTVFPEPSGLI